MARSDDVQGHVAAAPSWARSLLRLLFRAEATVAVVALAAIVIALTLDLAGREFFGKGVFTAQRFAVYCMIVCAMLGFALAVSWGAHMRIGGLERLFSATWSHAFNRLADVVSCGACLFLAYWSARFVAVSYEQQAIGMSIEIVLWPIQSILVWSFLSSALRYAVYAAWPVLRPADEMDRPDHPPIVAGAAAAAQVGPGVPRGRSNGSDER